MLNFVLLVLAVPVLWFILSLIVSLLVPKRRLGLGYLRRQLKRKGFNCDLLPEDFLKECVYSAEKSVLLQEMMGQSKTAVNAKFAQAIDTFAFMATQYARNPDMSVFSDAEYPSSPYVVIFRKYDLKAAFNGD